MRDSWERSELPLLERYEKIVGRCVQETEERDMTSRRPVVSGDPVIHSATEEEQVPLVEGV